MQDRFAKQVIHHLVQQGVRRICLSPGSRSTPLAYAAAQEEQLEKQIHFDERGAGFHAYGYAKASQTPVAILVTSGTAVANLFPAVVEASLDRVPLIILSADRPHELRDCGANQTCDQVKIFTDYVRWGCEIPCPDPFIPDGYIGSTIAQAVYRATHAPKGPVHLNCLFREPFLSEEHPNLSLKTQYEHCISMVPSSTLLQWGKKLATYEKGVIVVGSLTTSRSLNPIFQLAEQLDWPILPDIISGLRSEGVHHTTISYYDYVLNNAPQLHADCILHFGDRLVSKSLQEWIRGQTPHFYGMVTDHPYRHDSHHILTHRIQCDPTIFSEEILSYIPRRISWLNSWKTFSHLIEGHVDEYIPSQSEPGLIRFLHHHLPSHFSLFFSNSMPIRDADLFLFPRFHRAPFFGKRGTSGIDGNIATAIGLAEGSNRPLVALLGDLAALHDLNSLAQIRSCKVPIIFIIINNQGGGIFSFVPIAEKHQFNEEYMATVHDWSFEDASRMFHIPYLSIETPALLSKYLREEKTIIIEFKTKRIENYRIHKKIEQEIKSKIQDLTFALN